MWKAWTYSRTWRNWSWGCGEKSGQTVISAGRAGNTKNLGSILWAVSSHNKFKQISDMIRFRICKGYSDYKRRVYYKRQDWKLKQKLDLSFLTFTWMYHVSSMRPRIVCPLQISISGVQNSIWHILFITLKITINYNNRCYL